jgi:twinkle protein
MSDTLGDIFERLVITKEMIDKETGESLPDDFKIKTTESYFEQLKKYYAGEKDSGYSLPFAKADGHFAVRLGELSCFTGVSGHGKSMMLSQICLYLMNYTKVLIASMEMKPVLTLSRMITQSLGDPNPTEKYMKEFCDKYNDKLYVYDQQGVTDSKDMFAVLQYGKEILGIDVFVIDSLMKMGDISEDNYDAQKMFIDKLAAYCRDLNIHVFLVCHTRKMSDEYTQPDATNILGSSHIRNLSDNILLCFRRREIEDLRFQGNLPPEREKDPTAYLVIQKQRNYTFEGTFALWFDEKSLTYKERPL